MANVLKILFKWLKLRGIKWTLLFSYSIPSFIFFLNDHFLSAGADIRKWWALNKCSLSDYTSGWMTYIFLQTSLLSGEESRPLTNFALEADRRAVWGQHGTLLTNETGRCLLEDLWEWHFCIFKRDSWNELPLFFQGLSSSPNVVSGVVSRSFVTMWGKSQTGK